MSAGVLFDLFVIKTDPAFIGIARLAALAVNDSALAFASALWCLSSAFKKPIRAILTQQLELLLSVGGPMGRGAASGRLAVNDSVAGLAEAAGPKRPEHLSITLCALLCLPKSSSPAADWASSKPLVQHLLASRHLRDVVSAALRKGGAEPPGASSAGQLPPSAPVPAPPFVEILFGRPKSAEELSYAFAFRVALRTLAALPELAAGPTGAGAPAGGPATAEAPSGGDEPSAKRLRPNEPMLESFEDEMFGEETQVKVKVREETAREMRLKARHAFTAACLPVASAARFRGTWLLPSGH